MTNLGKKKVSSLILAIFIIATSANWSAQSWEKRFQEGEKYFQEKNFNKAITIFSEILKKPEKDELSAKSALRIGQCYLALKDYEKARQFFREAGKWNEELREQAQIGIALTYMNEGKTDLAIDILAEIISSSRSDANLAYAYYDRALCYKKKNWIKKALSDLREAKKKAKNDETLSKVIKEELSKCESLYQEFTTKENSYLLDIQMKYLAGDLDACASIYRELARFCEDWGEMEKAIDYEQQAMDCSTSEEFKAGSLMNIGWRYCKVEKYEEAGLAFRQVAEDYPQSSYAPEALLRAGDMYSSAGKREEARKCYETLIQKYPDDTRVSFALLNLAWSHFNRDITQMEGLLEEIIRRFPQTEIGYFTLGYLNELRGKYTEAIDAYKKCADYGGSYRFLALNGIGSCLYKLGKRGDIKKLEESFQVYIPLLKDEDTPSPIRAQAIILGVRASLNRRMDRGIGYNQLWSFRDIFLGDDVRRALEPPLLALLHLALSRCYLQVGDFQKAIELWSQPGIGTSIPPSLSKSLALLEGKFAPILMKSSLRSVGEKALEKCRFTSMDSFFLPKGREYPEIYIIYGTNCPDAQRELYEKIIKELVNSDFFLTFPSDKVKVLKDKEAEEQDLSEVNLLLIGSPSHNSLLEKAKASLPLKLGEKSVVVKDRRYEGDDICLAMSVPNPFNKEKEALIIWSANPSSFSGFDNSFLDMPLGYIIFQKGFSIEDKNILEAGFFYEHPDRTYEPF